MLDAASNDTITESFHSVNEEDYDPHDGAFYNEEQVQPSNDSQESQNIDKYKHPKYIVKWSEIDVSGINY